MESNDGVSPHQNERGGLGETDLPLMAAKSGSAIYHPSGASITENALLLPTNGLAIETMNPFELRTYLEQKIDWIDALKNNILKIAAVNSNRHGRELMDLTVKLINLKRHLQSKAMQLRQFTEY